jgi:hypothetical protein
MWQMLERHAVDLLVLDLMLPDTDGLTLCRDLRAKSNLPVLMLTARGEETDRIVGIEMGADDYLVKPFNPRELLARIKSILRRTRACRPTCKPGNRCATFVLPAGRWTPLSELLSAQTAWPRRCPAANTAAAHSAGPPQPRAHRDQLLEMSHGREADRAWTAPSTCRSAACASAWATSLYARASPQLIKTVRGLKVMCWPRCRHTGTVQHTDLSVVDQPDLGVCRGVAGGASDDPPAAATGAGRRYLGA